MAAKKKNQTTVNVVNEEKDLKGSELNWYVSFEADGLVTGRTMFKTYAE